MDAIFREHFIAVHRYISDKVREPDVADDLTSQVFLKALRWLQEDRRRGGAEIGASGSAWPGGTKASRDAQGTT
jgi:DNA-directed RNA polymerase specialized sigma24 family protein